MKSLSNGDAQIVQRRGERSPASRRRCAISRSTAPSTSPVYAEKALAELTDSAGGYLLTPELADSVLMLIRNRVAVTKMPVTHVQPRTKRTTVGLSGGASAARLQENAAIPASAECSRSPRRWSRPLGALVDISNRLLADATSTTRSPPGAGR